MRFVIFSKDKSGSLSIRKANREAHLAWLNEDGEMAGSLLVVECESRAALDGWMSRDPYAAAGLPAEVTIKPFLWAINPPD